MNKVIVTNRKEPSFLTAIVGVLFLIMSLFILLYTYGLFSSFKLTLFEMIFVSIWFACWIIGISGILFIVLFESYGVEQIHCRWKYIKGTRCALFK